MVAYLFAEIAKNFYLIHHTEEWINVVTCSQRGDCCFEINPDLLPEKEEMEKALPWEKGIKGPDLLNAWLEEYKAVPFDYNRGLDDKSLSGPVLPEFHKLKGTNFFRGLALIDMAEAMLKKAFGKNAVAVRVNAAGQGDYFQLHIDTQRTDPGKVKHFINRAFYTRFGIFPDPPFVEVRSGGGAVGAKLSRFDSLPHLIQLLLSGQTKSS
jgi:hypothetical protein